MKGLCVCSSANRVANPSPPAADRICDACRLLLASPRKQRMASANETGAPASPSEPSPNDKRDKGGSGALLYLLLGGGVLLCCCCSVGGGGGAWIFWPKSEPLVANWESKDGKGDTEFTIVINDKEKGTYRAGKGESRPFKWKRIDSTTIELSLDKAGDTFWTGEQTAKFTATIAGSNLTLAPKAANQRPVTFKKAS